MVVGDCANNLPALLAIVNEAQQRLIDEGGETGWWGSYDKIAFQISRNNPYFTLSRYYARAINIDVCNFPIRIQNEFYELLDDGIGLMSPHTVKEWCGALEGYERGVHSTMVDLTPANQYVRIYKTDDADVGKRVLFSGAIDQNGHPIYTQDGISSVNGFFLTLTDDPFTTSPFIVTGWQQIVKDQTQGDVTLTQVDANSGDEVTLSRYAADETNPAYRRYYINRLPCSCCPPPNTPTVLPAPVTITCMAKREFIPVQRDTDPLIISNIPALIEEAQAITYSSMDSPNAAGQELKHHRKAISLLQAEQRHYVGELMPAVVFAPFGTARLAKAGIGTMI